MCVSGCLSLRKGSVLWRILYSLCARILRKTLRILPVWCKRLMTLKTIYGTTISVLLAYQSKPKGPILVISLSNGLPASSVKIICLICLLWKGRTKCWPECYLLVLRLFPSWCAYYTLKTETPSYGWHETFWSHHQELQNPNFSWLLCGGPTATHAMFVHQETTPGLASPVFNALSSQITHPSSGTITLF